MDKSMDVLDAKEPQFSESKYIACYNFWRNTAGEEHFDIHVNIN